MNNTKKRCLTLPLVLMMLPAAADAYDFEYSFGDPSLDTSKTYIESMRNIEIRYERDYRYWKPMVGAATYETTTPGELVYHFDFAALGYTDPVSEISLGLFMPIFHWSYSQGHNVLYGSTDGSSWINLAEASGVDYAGYANIGAISGLDTLLGTSDLWLKAELYSYGSSAASGGVYTNTAQLTRYDVIRDNTTFRIGVNFGVDEPGGSVPVPATLALMSLGIAGLGLARKRRAV